MPWTTSDTVTALRAKHPAIEVAVDTLDGWRRHISGRNASVLAFFGFLSIFPLLLAATTILGFVLEGNEDLQQRIIDGALADLPVLGQQLQDDPASLSGNFWALAIGLVGALWSSTKAFVGMQGAFDDTWEVSVDHRDAMPKPRSKALLGLLFIGGAQVGSLAITTVVNSAGLPNVGRLALLVTTLAINITMIAAMYRFLTAATPSWRDVWPGAVVAGVAYTLLQHFGTMIVRSITENANATYGNFALVLGLVTWLSLLAIATIMSCEFNAALVRYREGSLDRVQPADQVEESPAPATA
jgi:YihY family inner membrane protein